ncbi:Transcription intermediary factor 1-alpha [Operophtera brumata]|uniref:Transcription intermediary factor 1-alpha n=1 Tax=Operophtera brumata TaxID=104452 RepID=A0A0L7LAN5_OPEBR|nr:Transcription intermediary factor 1-alpha [Operophtera brumata]
MCVCVCYRLTNAINTRGKQLVLRLNEVCDAKQRTLSEKKDALEQLAAITDHCVEFVSSALEHAGDTALLYCKVLYASRGRARAARGHHRPLRRVRLLGARARGRHGAPLLQGTVRKQRTRSSSSRPSPTTASSSSPRRSSTRATRRSSTARYCTQAEDALEQLAAITDHCVEFVSSALEHAGDTALLYCKPVVAAHLQRIKSRRADIPNPEIPVRITLALDKLPDLVRVVRSVRRVSWHRGGWYPPGPALPAPPGRAGRAGGAQSDAHDPLATRDSVVHDASASSARTQHSLSLISWPATVMGAYASNAFAANASNAGGRRSGGPRTPSPAPPAYQHHQQPQQQQQQQQQQQMQMHQQIQMQQQHHAKGHAAARALHRHLHQPQDAEPQSQREYTRAARWLHVLSGTCVTCCNGRRAQGGGGASLELDKVCAESVQDLIATIAKLDSNGVQVLPEPEPAPVHSSTDDSRGKLGVAGVTAGAAAGAGAVAGSGDPNEDWCAVCMDGGELMCCDKCPKVFHQYCHIPTIEKLPDETESWQCLLCVNFAELPPALGEEAPDGGLPPRLQKLVERVTLELYCQYELSLAFREPVPPENLHYHSKITRPMCLDMIRLKLQPRASVRYSHPAQFVADCRLLFRNAYRYNPVRTYKLQPRASERYSHPAQFVADCRLLFRNAYRYNPVRTYKLQPRASVRYSHPAQFVADCRLLFRNAYRYNPPESQYYKDAKRLEEFFDAQLAKWLPEFALWSGEGDAPPKRARLD